MSDLINVESISDLLILPGRESDLEYEQFAPSTWGIDSAKEMHITLSFEEAARGVEMMLELPARTVCWKCQGSKSEPGYTWVICPYCEGTGIETEQTGYLKTRRTCSYCNGTKQFYRFPCIECYGTGSSIQPHDQK